MGQNKIWVFLEKYLVGLSIISFILGVGLAYLSTGFAIFVSNIISYVIDLYAYIAPVIIYLILAPTLIKLSSVKMSNGKNFTLYATCWLAGRRLMACLWGVVFTVFVFGLPLYADGGSSVSDAVLESLTLFGWMAIYSFYFYAIYAALLTVVVSHKIPKIKNFLTKGCDYIEWGGKYLMPVIPVFMLAIGAYLYYLPTILNTEVGGMEASAYTNTMTVFGFAIHPGTPAGIILVYLVIALLVGLACIIWHFILLLYTKHCVKDFSIKNYFKNYWSKVYPLLWATSSEALATPLNLHLVKKHYPNIKPEVRRFVVGAGSFLNINGTLICVIILAGAVCSLLGIEISFVQLLIAVPLVFMLGYGVPGIPGELIIFAGPMVTILGVKPEIAPIFLALYVGLQIGLPDSFRSGSNSTDNCLCALLINKTYEKNSIAEDLTVKHYDNIFLGVKQ